MLARSQAEVCRVELSLRQRMARTYARYRTALAVVEEYRDHSLPDAKEAYELYLTSFQNRTAAWPQVLVAQRTYFQISVDYIEALEQLRRSVTAILGLLLVDGLDEPPGPSGEGRMQREQAPTCPTRSARRAAGAWKTARATPADRLDPHVSWG